VPLAVKLGSLVWNQSYPTVSTPALYVNVIVPFVHTSAPELISSFSTTASAAPSVDMTERSPAHGKVEYEDVPTAPPVQRFPNVITAGYVAEPSVTTPVQEPLSAVRNGSGAVEQALSAQTPT
jgi:hypothetical protein